ncbi:hypothetical protein ACC754_39300, partial [Rhizobium johnstonii]
MDIRLLKSFILIVDSGSITRAADLLHIAHVIDVTDRQAMAELNRRVEFDILVNNAGVDRPKKFLEADEGDIDL